MFDTEKYVVTTIDIFALFCFTELVAFGLWLLVMFLCVTDFSRKKGVSLCSSPDTGRP